MLWGEGGDISCEGQDTGHCLGCSGAGPSADSVSAVTGYRLHRVHQQCRVVITSQCILISRYLE